VAFSPVNSPSGKSLPLDTLATGDRARPALSIPKLVLLLCAGQVVLWAVGASLLYKAPGMDSAEQFVWAFALESGYWKHPPLPSWIMHGLLAVFGPSVTLSYVAAQAMIVTALALTWRLGLEFMSAQRSLIAMLLTSMVLYHNIDGGNFNHSTVLLPFQAAMTLVFFLAARRGSLPLWLLAGALAGLLGLVKYVAVFPVAGLLLYFLLDRSLHHRRNMLGMLLALACGLLVIFPHLLWLRETDYMIFNYARSTVRPADGMLATLRSVVSFFFVQLGQIAPMLLGLGWLLRKSRAVPGPGAADNTGPVSPPGAPLPTPASWPSSPPSSSSTPVMARRDRLFIWINALATLVLTMAFGIVSQHDLESRWGVNAFLYAGLLAMMLAPRIDGRLLRTALTLAVGLQLLVVPGLMIGKSILAEQTGHRTRANFPGAVLTAETDRIWRAHTDAPLRIVVAGMWIGGNVVANMAHPPAVLMYGMHDISPWVKPEDVRDCGAMVLADRTADKPEPPGSYPDEARLLAGASDRGSFTLPWAPRKPPKAPHPNSSIAWGYIAPAAPENCRFR
jgi:4-amino-4-deoxy-L-arabinose transferase-like glycosyltransferase